MLRFSKANAKIESLSAVPSIAGYLANKRKVYSFDILSGHNCPYAQQCRSSAVEGADGKRHIEDGPDTVFRCFSASQEALFPALYNLRKANGDEILAIPNCVDVKNALAAALPKNAGIVRIHVGGDFKTKQYFRGWALLAKSRPDVLFYAYTKSLPYWIADKDSLESIPNFVLTASRGGYKDNLIGEHKLREAVVVFSEQQAADLGLPIDHDDSHAAQKGGSFALLIHGGQPAGSEAGKALRELKGKGSYSRK